MKYLFKCQWLFVLGLVGLAACSDDDDETSVKQGFRVDDHKYSLSEAYTTVQENADYFTHQIILTGEGLDVTEGPEFDGSSDVVSFSLLSETEVLAEGEYTIRDTPNEPGESSLAVAYVNFSADDVDQDYEKGYAGAGGKIIVSKDGDTYTFKVTCGATVTIISAGSGTPIFIPADGDLQVQYKGELTDVTNVPDDLRQPAGRRLFFP